MASFPRLFSPFAIKGVTIRNRIFSTGHDTDLAHDGIPTPALIAYQRARARGGVGLIVVQVVAVHETARYTAEVLMGTSDDGIPAFRTLFDAIHAEGATAFVQLFHPGRELLWRRDGIVQAPLAPSDVPTERFRLTPRALDTALIDEIVAGYGTTARRMADAGADGVELVASHGYLPAQFMNEQANRRTDRYGGALENRLRFTREAVAAIRRDAPDGLVVGIRLSSSEYDLQGIADDDTLAICAGLRDDFDYFNIIGGTSASAAGAVHIVPPMSVETGYLGPFAARLRQLIDKPVFLAGRVNQPQDAERLVASGAADMCGMTRAMICDPEMPNKAAAGRADDIRACIGCNQACIGHAQLGLPISCIQYPETGRELMYGSPRRAVVPRKLAVVGGGPGGMKAAAVAAEAGHSVTLYERSAQLGGQTLLAQLLPHRAEFGGIATNLAREAERAGVTVVLRTEATADLIAAARPDAVIVATGGVRRLAPTEGEGGMPVVHSDDILSGAVAAGRRVVVYDWRADWIGVGIAEKLAADGAHVILAVNGICAAAAIQNYVRDAAIARLFRLGVEVRPFLRLFGVDDTSVYFVHTAAQDPVVIDDVDMVVTVYPNAPDDDLAARLRALDIPTQVIGDALSPRTAEEAVFEGLRAALSIGTYA